MQPRNQLVNAHKSRLHTSLTAFNDNKRTVINPKARRVLRILSPVSPKTFSIQNSVEDSKGSKQFVDVQGRKKRAGGVSVEVRAQILYSGNTTRDGSPRQLDVADSARSLPESSVFTQTRSYRQFSVPHTHLKGSWLIISDSIA